VGYFNPAHLRDPAERERADDVRLLLMVSEANLRLGRADLMHIDALERVAGNEGQPVRARRRAAAVLARIAMALGRR
jgi:hypothetical protein